MAFWIDTALMLVVFAAVLPVISGESVFTYYESSWNFDPATAEDQPILRPGDIFVLVRDIIYYTAAIALWRATVGMGLCRLRVMRVDGSRVGVGRAFARYLASNLSLLLLGVGYLLIAFREDKRGLHDLICDTVVVRLPGR